MKRNIVKGAVSHSYCFSFYYCNFFRLKRLYSKKKNQLQTSLSKTATHRFNNVFFEVYFYETALYGSYIIFFKLVSQKLCRLFQTRLLKRRFCNPLNLASSTYCFMLTLVLREQEAAFVTVLFKQRKQQFLEPQNQCQLQCVSHNLF